MPCEITLDADGRLMVNGFTYPDLPPHPELTPGTYLRVTVEFPDSSRGSPKVHFDRDGTRYHLCWLPGAKPSRWNEWQEWPTPEVADFVY